jgi:glutamate-1-semialdehyde 2,1-aminomutase
VPVDAAAGFAPLFHRLLGQGFYLSPSAYEVGFLSAAHQDADIDRLAEALRAA